MRQGKKQFAKTICKNSFAMKPTMHSLRNATFDKYTFSWCTLSDISAANDDSCYNCCKAWNILSDNLRHRDIGLHAFKSGLKLYYTNALSKVYNCDDPRSWKSVCIKCKRARSLDGVLSCC